MRRGRIARAVGVLATAALVGAPTAGADPSQVYRDYADNGRLDQAYSAEQVKEALGSAVVQGYGNPVANVGLKNSGTGVAGVQKSVGKRPLAATRQRGQLPFTGAELTIFAIGGILLLGSGLLLRVTARERSLS